jgi:hypothetical protein
MFGIIPQYSPQAGLRGPCLSLLPWSELTSRLKERFGAIGILVDISFLQRYDDCKRDRLRLTDDCGRLRLQSSTGPHHRYLCTPACATGSVSTRGCGIISIAQTAAGRMYIEARKFPFRSHASGVRNQYPLLS